MRLKIVLFLMVFISCRLCVTASAADVVYEMGAFPSVPAAKLQELFTPLAEELTRELGKKVRLSTKPTFEAFEEVLNSEYFDIAHIQPFDYVDAHDKHNYLALARRNEELEALFVVRPDSKLNSIRDLKGKKVSSPPPDAAISHLADMALKDAGLNLKTDVRREYARNHFSCLQNVLIGEADVCVAVVQMIKKIEKEKKMEVPFKIIHRSAKIPPTLFIVHKRVSQKDREVMLKVILGLQDNAGGRKILDSLGFKPFVPARDGDYNVIRKFMRAGK